MDAAGVDQGPGSTKASNSNDIDVDTPEINNPIFSNQDNPNKLSTSSGTLYFAYGSNLSLVQMQARCPSSKFVGVGLLSGWRWIINERGYANVVATDEVSNTGVPASYIYGLVYTLTSADEDSLDMYEGVPEAYTKEKLSISFWPEGGQPVVGAGQEAVALVYVDRERTGDGVPWPEYVHRMRRGMQEAGEKGVSESWMRSAFGRWLDMS
ncbi:hypothetical protein MMC34_007594 [Xylographa carneopallida]|nr:hypothetical protein [Xylographa carneopallida]